MIVINTQDLLASCQTQGCVRGATSSHFETGTAGAKPFENCSVINRAPAFVHRGVQRPKRPAPQILEF